MKNCKAPIVKNLSLRYHYPFSIYDFSIHVLTIFYVHFLYIYMGFISFYPTCPHKSFSPKIFPRFQTLSINQAHSIIIHTHGMEFDEIPRNIVFCVSSSVRRGGSRWRSTIGYSSRTDEANGNARIPVQREQDHRR